MSPKTSLHSSLREKTFVIWNSLWEHPRLVNTPKKKKTATPSIGVDEPLCVFVSFLVSLVFHQNNQRHAQAPCTQDFGDEGKSAHGMNYCLTSGQVAIRFRKLEKAVAASGICSGDLSPSCLHISQMHLRRPSIVAVTEEGGRAFPERTIGERTILGVSDMRHLGMVNRGCFNSETKERGF